MAGPIVLLILSPKGGTGKSTVARHVAAAAAAAGLRVATIDTDPQGTLTHWWNRRPDTAPAIDHYQAPLSAMEGGAFAPPRDGTQLVVIDTPTAIEAFPLASVALIDAATLILMPLQPTPEDLLSAGAMVELVRGRGRHVVTLLNRCPARSPDVADARELLGQLGEVAQQALGDRRDVPRSFSRGLTVPELVRARSAPEWGALWEALAARLGLGLTGAGAA